MSGWKIILIMFFTDTRNILEKIQTRLVGDYLCYRHYDDKEIKFKKINGSEKEYAISLKSFVSKTESNMEKYVTFEGIQK